MSCTPFSRRRLVVGALTLAALFAGLLPAGADTSVSRQPISSAGTGTSAGKARKVLAIVERDGVAYFGGEFKNTVRPSATRKYLAAVDVNSGALTSWNPNADGAVRAMVLAADGEHVYVGGDFKRIGGASQRKVALISLATGAVVTSFSPSVDGRVRALALSGDRLYVGGDFHSVSGAARPQLAAVDAHNGARLDWTPPANTGGSFVGQVGTRVKEGDGAVYAIAVSGDGRTVHAGGSFTHFGGRSGILSLDAGSGVPVGTQFTMDRPVFGLARWSVDGQRVFAAAGGAGGRLYALDPGRSNPAWRAKVDGDAVAVAASETTAYLMGHYDYIVDQDSSCYKICPGGPYRKHIAGFNAETGALDPWNPQANTSTGPYTATVGENHLLIGGAFTKINGVSQPGLAIFPGEP